MKTRGRVADFLYLQLEEVQHIINVEEVLQDLFNTFDVTDKEDYEEYSRGWDSMVARLRRRKLK